MDNTIYVYSEKYDIRGFIQDHGLNFGLCFDYEDKLIQMGLAKTSVDYDKYGKDLIESYVENLAVPKVKRKLRLHYWWVCRRKDRHGSTYAYASGIVTGHERLCDSHEAETSEVIDVVYNEEDDEILLKTLNSTYHCPLAYCNFDKQDENPDLLPDYEHLKEKYKDSNPNHSIEHGNVLLVLADFCDHYFQSLYYVPKFIKSKNPTPYTANVSGITLQDNYMIRTNDGTIDIRYLTHFQNIELYKCNTNARRLFIENIGDSVIYVKLPSGAIRLEPYDFKEYKEKNIEKEPPALPNGDLYHPDWFRLK